MKCYGATRGHSFRRQIRLSRSSERLRLAGRASEQVKPGKYNGIVHRAQIQEDHHLRLYSQGFKISPIDSILAHSLSFFDFRATFLNSNSVK